MDLDDIENEATATANDAMMFFDLVKYLNTAFSATNEKQLLNAFLVVLDEYLEEQITAFRGELKYDEHSYHIKSYIFSWNRPT